MDFSILWYFRSRTTRNERVRVAQWMSKRSQLLLHGRMSHPNKPGGSIELSAKQYKFYHIVMGYRIKREMLGKSGGQKNKQELVTLWRPNFKTVHGEIKNLNLNFSSNFWALKNFFSNNRRIPKIFIQQAVSL